MFCLGFIQCISETEILLACPHQNYKSVSQLSSSQHQAQRQTMLTNNFKRYPLSHTRKKRKYRAVVTKRTDAQTETDQPFSSPLVRNHNVLRFTRARRATQNEVEMDKTDDGNIDKESQQTNKGIISLLSLHRDFIWNIISFINPNDHKRIIRISKRWNSLVKSHRGEIYKFVKLSQKTFNPN